MNREPIILCGERDREKAGRKKARERRREKGCKKMIISLASRATQSSVVKEASKKREVLRELVKKIAMY